MEETIGIIGVGRLGLCLALNLEKSGYAVIAVDKDQDHITKINSKTLISPEPELTQYLNAARQLKASTDIQTVCKPSITVIFICVPTPSLPNGAFDTSYITSICDELIALGAAKQTTHLIINSTVMPGVCDDLQKKMTPYNYTISYNPEFIAQGSIIKDQQYPDQVLIGASDRNVGVIIEGMYRKMCLNSPRYSHMTPTEAEVTKIAVNCFLTTKIAFANAIGDLTKTLGGNENNVLEAIGSDQRIGHKFLGYGYGYGGPCLPRDNRALGVAASEAGLQLPLSTATDLSNQLHTEFQSKALKQTTAKNIPIIFENLAYKSHSNIIEESQKLAVATSIAKDGYTVTLKDTEEVLSQIKEIHGSLFSYITRS
jgi:nucleotide sugar dehydrogenase